MVDVVGNILGKHTVKDKGVFSIPEMKGTTIGYLGRELKYKHTYDEEYFTKWQEDAQASINWERKRGREAAVIHKGRLHHYYSE